MARRKLHYSNVPADALFVSVYCSGRPDSVGVPQHHDTPWRIATFYPSSTLPSWPDGTPRWAEVLHRYWTATGKVLTLDTAPTRVAIAGRRVVTEEEYISNPAVFDAGSHSKYNLRCRTCGLEERIKEARLDPALARILSLGQREVSLLGLGAILVKT